MTLARQVILGSAAALAAGVLSACGAVNIRPQVVLPKPLIVPLAADVGLVIPPDLRNFVDRETRFGIDWAIVLGPGETRLMRDVFADLFRHVEEFQDLAAAKRSGTSVAAVFEPHLEQYSFVTGPETGGRYFAVTIRYRIDLYTPQGELVDTYTLTGYGNSLASGMSAGAPVSRASAGAMRDAAAKFLVQFPEQPFGQQLARSEAVVARRPASVVADRIEAVPIDEPVELD